MGPGFDLQFSHRLDHWCSARPECAPALKLWRELFDDDPYDPRLAPLATDSPEGESFLQYLIPGVPIMIVLLLERPRQATERRWARVIHPRDPDDVVPDHEMT